MTEPKRERENFTGKPCKSVNQPADRGLFAGKIMLLCKRREKTTMQSFKVEGLRRCKLCNSDKIVIRRDASNSFQVKCEKCGNHTKWQKKIDAVIEWFNQ